MKRISTLLAINAITSLMVVSAAANAQEAKNDVQPEKSEPINNRLHIQKTDGEFKQQYIDYSVDREESRKYLELIRSNRVLLRKIQERELVLQYNEQWIKLQKQEAVLNQSGEATTNNQAQSKQSLSYTGFTQGQEKKIAPPSLQSIKGGESATFLYDGAFIDAESGDTLPNGEVVEIVNGSTVKLKSKSGTRTLRGMPVGE